MPSYLCVTPILSRRREDVFSLLALEVMLPGLSATRMEVGPAATNLILIVMTATLLWRRAREVR